MEFLGLEDDEDNKYEEEQEEVFPSRKKKNNNNNNNNVLSMHSQKNVKVVLQELESYEQAQTIADHLCSHRPVIVNLQRLDAIQARRVIDFLSGCVYGLRGTIKKVGLGIFICTPENIDIQGDIEDFLDEN